MVIEPHVGRFCYGSPLEPTLYSIMDLDARLFLSVADRFSTLDYRLVAMDKRLGLIEAALPHLLAA